MCIVHNPVGSLKVVMDHLHGHGLTEFNSLQEILHFQSNYTATRQNIHLQHSKILEEERSGLEDKIEKLSSFIEMERAEWHKKHQARQEPLLQQQEKCSYSKAGIWTRLILLLTINQIRLHILYNEWRYKARLWAAMQKSMSSLLNIRKRYQFLNDHFDTAVGQNSRPALEELERKKSLINEVIPFIYGAIGEQMVSKELEQLPDDYVLINDLNCAFHPAIFHRPDNSYIKSTQMDHLLVSQAGIFLIETKNWSENSINNQQLYSPISQIRRASYALYKMLSNETTRLLGTHYRGDRKIPIKNIVVFIQPKPNIAFDYVKILGLSELRPYLNHFSPVFSAEEVQKIAEYLLSLNGSTRSYKPNPRYRGRTSRFRLFR